MLANRVVQKRLSVREAEKLVARELAQQAGAGAERRASARRAAGAGDRDLCASRTSSPTCSEPP